MFCFGLFWCIPKYLLHLSKWWVCRFVEPWTSILHISLFLRSCHLGKARCLTRHFMKRRSRGCVRHLSSRFSHLLHIFVCSGILLRGDGVGTLVSFQVLKLVSVQVLFAVINYTLYNSGTDAVLVHVCSFTTLCFLPTSDWGSKRPETWCGYLNVLPRTKSLEFMMASYWYSRGQYIAGLSDNGDNWVPMTQAANDYCPLGGTWLLLKGSDMSSTKQWLNVSSPL